MSGAADRPVPDLRSDPRAISVRKKAIPVEVVFAAADGVCDTLEGPVRYRAGDAVLTGSRGERWPLRRHLFDRSYRPVGDGEAGAAGPYVKTLSSALALRLDAPVAVPVGWQRDPLAGKAGDWLLLYSDGSSGIVQDEIFRETYEPWPEAPPAARRR